MSTPISTPLQTGFPQQDKLLDKHGNLTKTWALWLSYINQTVNQTQQAQYLMHGRTFPNEFESEDFWSNAGGPGAGSWDVINSEVDHIGIQRLTTDVNNGDIVSAWLPVAAAGVYRWDQLVRARFVFRTPATLTSVRFEAGLSSDPRASWPATVFEAGNNMVYLHYDTSTDTALRFKVRAAGVTTTSYTLASPCPASTWVDVTFQRRRATPNGPYWLDAAVNMERGKVTTTVSTGLPADDATFGGMFRVGTLTIAARSLDVDLADADPIVLGQRWTDAL